MARKPDDESNGEKGSREAQADILGLSVLSDVAGGCAVCEVAEVDWRR